MKEYAYSRSVTIRVYAFLAGFAGWALWDRTRIEGGDGSTPMFILGVALAVSLAYLIYWRNRRLTIEFLVVAFGVALISPLVDGLGRNVSQLASDALLIGVVVLGLLVVFIRLPPPAETEAGPE